MNRFHNFHVVVAVVTMLAGGRFELRHVDEFWRDERTNKEVEAAATSKYRKMFPNADAINAMAVDMDAGVAKLSAIAHEKD